MGRRRTTILDDLMVLPWWCSPIAALVAYVGIGGVIPAMLPQGHAAFVAFHSTMPKIAQFAAFILLVPMPFAYLNGRAKRRLVDANKDLDSIRALSWREFEYLVAEAYRRKGYTVRENLRGGPDGGVDVTLEKHGKLHLVQCKQWKFRKVGIKEVREMYGLMAAHNAASVSVITSGMFTQEAENFARDKPIGLIDGPALNKLITSVRNVVPERRIAMALEGNTLANSCPKCGGELVDRVARRGANIGKSFLGCSTFPKCRYTRNI